MCVCVWEIDAPLSVCRLHCQYSESESHILLVNEGNSRNQKKKAGEYERGS